MRFFIFVLAYARALPGEMKPFWRLGRNKSEDASGGERMKR